MPTPEVRDPSNSGGQITGTIPGPFFSAVRSWSPVICPDDVAANEKLKTRANQRRAGEDDACTKLALSVLIPS